MDSEATRSRHAMDLGEFGSLRRAAVGPGPGIEGDIISREEGAVVLFTILGAARRRFEGSYVETYEGVDTLLRDISRATGRQKMSVEIPLYMFFGVDQDPSALGSRLDGNPDWMLFFTRLFPEYVKLDASRAGVGLDAEISSLERSTERKSLHVSELFQRVYEVEQFSDADGIRTLDGFLAQMRGVGDRMRVVVESSGNVIVFGITNRWPDRGDEFWHISMFRDSTHVSTGAHGIPKGTRLTNTVHYTSEKQDFVRAFVDFGNFNNPRNKAARDLLSKIKSLDYRDIIAEYAVTVGSQGTPYVMPAPAAPVEPQVGPVVGGPPRPAAAPAGPVIGGPPRPAAAPAGPVIGGPPRPAAAPAGPVIGGPPRIEQQLASAQRELALARLDLDEADGAAAEQQARARVDAATARIQALQQRHGGKPTKISSSRRLPSGPTRKAPSSGHARRRTHRKRASRSGKGGYRATRTGRKV